MAPGECRGISFGEWPPAVPLTTRFPRRRAALCAPGTSQSVRPAHQQRALSPTRSPREPGTAFRGPEATRHPQQSCTPKSWTRHARTRRCRRPADRIGQPTPEAVFSRCAPRGSPVQHFEARLPRDPPGDRGPRNPVPGTPQEAMSAGCRSRRLSDTRGGLSPLRFPGGGQFAIRAPNRTTRPSPSCLSMMMTSALRVGGGSRISHLASGRAVGPATSRQRRSGGRGAEPRVPKPESLVPRSSSVPIGPVVRQVETVPESVPGVRMLRISARREAGSLLAVRRRHRTGRWKGANPHDAHTWHRFGTD
jgi:hypothetical protein